MGATEILGIDSSQKMIAKAVADNSDDKIKYKVCGVEEYIYPENTYDLVVSNLVLHYIENLANVYQKVYCTLKVGGHFLFNIEHPTFTAGVNEDWIYDENGKPKYWPIDNYYYTGERETNFLGQRVIKQHHTLTQILNPLIKCVSIPWWRSHPIHKNRATESIWTEPCNPLLRAAKSTKRATFNL